MANLISKIKAPNNTEYLLKDSTLAADTGISIADIDSNNQRKIKNTGVTGVKGNSESAYRTGQVNLTAANIGAKATQSAVNDVSASGTSVTFISQVTQNTQGVITPVKKTVATMGAASADAAGSAGLVPAPAAGKQGQYLRGDGTWATPSNTTYTFDGTYNSSTNKAATVSTVTNAINALDVEESTGTTLQTITAISETNGKIAATYSDIASASTSGKGVVQLSSATNSTSTSLAATASAVKAAYDLAASKTANTGTVTKVTPGNGLINGTSGTSQTAITSTGTISIKEGGVTNAMLAGSIANGKLSNSKVTIAGNDVSLGGSVSADTLRESLGLSNAMHFVGTTTTAMSDGLTTKDVTVNSKTYTPNNGDVVLYSDAEFVWTGSAWERLGRDSSFKTTQTAVTDPSADGTDTAFIDSITQNANGVISPHKASLPTASTSTAGIMKVGTGLSASSGTVSVSYGTAANTACQGNDSRLSNARTPTSHTHGNLTNDGKITTTATIANGDKLVIVDSDTTAASKITGSSITFDGSTTTKALTPKGTWESFSKTDEKVKMTAAAGNTTVYLLGTTSTPSTTAANVNAVADSGFYISKSDSGTDMLVGPYIGANVVNSLDFQGKGPNLYDLNASTAFGSGTVPRTYLPLGGNGELGIVKVDSTMTATAAGVIGVKYGTAAGTAAEGNHNHDSKYVNVSGDTMTGTLTLKNTSANGGQLSFPSSYDTQAGAALTTSSGGLDIFGIPSADGKSRTGSGTTLGINPYTKKITGGYTFEGTATTASKLSNTSAIGGTDRPVYFTNGGVPSQTSYRMAGTNATATTALPITDDLNTGIWYVNGTNSTSLYSQSDGAAYVNKYSDSWIHEIYGDYRTGHIAVRGKNNGTWKDWYKVLDSGNYDDFALPLSGGTMTGALNLANNTWNLVGDDAYIGDINKAGHVGIQGKNGNTGLFFTTYNQTTKTTGASLSWDGTHLVSDKSIKTPTIICTDTGANAHVNLSRTGGHNSPNYINVPASGALAFSVGGAAGDRIVAMIESDKVIPFNTNETDIGTSSYQWKSMHSQTAVIDQHVTLQYNSTDASLDFVFA